MKNSTGALVAKAIDVDAAMFEHMVIQQMQEESKKKVSCSRDEDCSMFHCESSCDRDTKTCSGKLLSSNLMVSV